MVTAKGLIKHSDGFPPRASVPNICTCTFSHVSVLSLFFSLVLGLDSRLAKEALESAWFAAEIAIDEKAVNESHSKHAKLKHLWIQKPTKKMKNLKCVTCWIETSALNFQ